MCPRLADPNNGAITCSQRDDGVHSYEDKCTYTCNAGYKLNITGSPQRTCQSDGSWSGSPVSCTIMECPSSSLPMNSMLAESCSSTYQSMCDLQCEEGFNSSGSYRYVCNVSSNGLSLLWRSAGENITCVAGIHLFCLTSILHPLLLVLYEVSDSKSGVVIGGVAGGVAILIILILIVVFCVKWRPRKVSFNAHATSKSDCPYTSTYMHIHSAFGYICVK